MASVAHGSGSPFAGLVRRVGGPRHHHAGQRRQGSIRCRANYNVDGSGVNLKLDLRCSSDSFKFELQSSVSHSNGEVSGFWNELTNRVGGTVAGKAAGEQIQVRVDGADRGDARHQHPRRPAVRRDPVAGQQDVRGGDFAQPGTKQAALK